MTAMGIPAVSLREGLPLRQVVSVCNDGGGLSGWRMSNARIADRKDSIV